MLGYIYIAEAAYEQLKAAKQPADEVYYMGNIIRPHKKKPAWAEHLIKSGIAVRPHVWCK